MFYSWYKHGVGKNWFKNLEYSLWITLKDQMGPQNEDEAELWRTGYSKGW